MQSKNRKSLPKALIICAIKPEFLEIRKFLVEIDEEVHSLGDVYERGKFLTDTGAWDVLIARSGMGNTSAALCTERAVVHFDPQIVLFVGVAGGIKDVKMFDVVAAESVHGYEGGKAGVEFQSRPSVGLASYSLAERAHAEAATDRWRSRIKDPYTPASPDVYVGKVVAGEKVVASEKSAIFQMIKTHFSDALAVEMEASGFYEAIRRCADSGIRGLVIRGISDTIENKQDADREGGQRRAAAHAAAFAFEVLSRTTPDGSRLAVVSHASDVSLTFANGDSVLSLVRSPMQKRGSWQEHLEKIKLEHPQADGLNPFFNMDDLYRYNQQLEEYYREEKDYFSEILEFDSLRNRLIPIDLSVCNSGTKVADKLKITLVAANSLIFTNTPPREPLKPIPPERPRNRITGAFAHHQHNLMDDEYYSAIDDIASNIAGVRKDRNVPQWKLNGERAEITVSRIMHDSAPNHLPALWLALPASNGFETVNVEYSAIDVNATGPNRGTLTIELTVESDAEQ